MSEQSEWISLGEAAKLLGVHPTTVRNWADQGDIPFRRTPGRHRRFERAALQAWAADRKNKAKERPSANTNAQVLVEYALGHTRFGVEEGELAQQDWYEQMSEASIAQLRQFGRRLLEALLRHLEDSTPEAEELKRAEVIGHDYADMLQAENLTLVQAVKGFIYFDNFLIESVVQMMAPNMSANPSEWSDLLQQINAFTNMVLLTMISDYQQA